MERKQRRRFVWLAGFTVAVLVVALVFILARPKPLPPLPNPNGYDRLVQASSLLLSDPGTAFDLSKLSHETLRRLVATNSESLRLLRLGLSQRCAVPMNFAQTNCTNFVADMFSQLMKMRSLAHLLVAEGQLAELENRPGDAAHSYTDCIRFGNESVRGGMLMNRLIGISFEATGRRPLVSILPQLSPGELRGLTLQLDQICRARVPWKEVMDMERRFSAQARRQSGQPLSWLVAEWQFLPRKRIAQQNDLYNGEPLVYRPQRTNWVLYSVGPDGADNGGVSVTRPSSATVFIGPRFLSKLSPDLLIQVPSGDVYYDSTW